VRDSINDNNAGEIEQTPLLSNLALVSVVNLMSGIFIQTMTMLVISGSITSSTQTEFYIIISTLVSSLIMNIIYFGNKSILNYVIKYPFSLPASSIVCFLFCYLSRYDSAGIIPFSIILRAFSVVFAGSILFYIVFMFVFIVVKTAIRTCVVMKNTFNVIFPLRLIIDYFVFRNLILVFQAKSPNVSFDKVLLVDPKKLALIIAIFFTFHLCEDLIFRMLLKKSGKQSALQLPIIMAITPVLFSISRVNYYDYPYVYSFIYNIVIILLICVFFRSFCHDAKMFAADLISAVESREEAIRAINAEYNQEKDEHLQ